MQNGPAKVIALNYSNKLELDITPQESSPTWARVCKGFANLSEGMNEVLYQASYMCDQGWGSTEVTGGQYIVTLTGVRYWDDTLQNWVFSDAVMHHFGDARKTTLRITRGDETVLTWSVTLANITMSGGDANQPAAISVAIHGNGAPVLGDGPLGELSVVSVAGSGPSVTQIYVNPALTPGNSYVYKLGTTVQLPEKGEVISAGWLPWDGTEEITASDGQQISIVEVDANGAAQSGGVATVTAE